jgi:hypothetical protein
MLLFDEIGYSIGWFKLRGLAADVYTIQSNSSYLQDDCSSVFAGLFDRRSILVPEKWHCYQCMFAERSRAIPQFQACGDIVFACVYCFEERRNFVSVAEQAETQAP